MSLEPAVAILQQLDLFAGLDPVRLEVVAFTCERREYAPGATLFTEGDEADCAYLILGGEAVMLARDDAGSPNALRLDTGDLIGETALFEPGKRRTTVRAVTSLYTLRIGRDMFQRLLGEFPEMAGSVAARLADRLNAVGAELEDLRSRLAIQGKKGEGGNE
ncbi:Crp/Fnr family transcriptional regulator [Parvibaculum sp.]|uniref:cyclic nucleotide-binding domain-containing protein n=2 Tax=Parvibaculum sp. TaxID=2024848 RepID=UPI001AFE2ECD|nr:Crp/Fnr family transcriptional regulator [Parvibaculum sp.]MBO6677427.1 Crp/Fnr family transcriptional regulator [Parvibaculum sp.]MBO6686175.1 Crp/Fnr family transcriptional regulator [Parvibaculum sp.]MBO6905976.1 Crp/Fnr family transcriptional regulator [Parvibaculum sp.]